MSDAHGFADEGAAGIGEAVPCPVEAEGLAGRADADDVRRAVFVNKLISADARALADRLPWENACPCNEILSFGGIVPNRMTPVMERNHPASLVGILATQKLSPSLRIRRRK